MHLLNHYNTASWPLAFDRKPPISEGSVYHVTKHFQIRYRLLWSLLGREF